MDPQYRRSNNDIIPLILMLLAFIITIYSFTININTNKYISAKKFMVEHPEVKIEVFGQIYDKYTPRRELRNLRYCRGIITVHVDQEKHEVFLEGGVKKIGNTNYGIISTWKGLKFQVLKPIKIQHIKEKQPIKIQHIKQKIKENIKMDLSIGTWIILIIIMIIVAKIAHKISLKTIFKPTKKISKHVKKEWDES